MHCRINHLITLSWTLLLFAAQIPVSTRFSDEMLVPKWFATGCVLVLSVTLLSIRLIGKEHIRKGPRLFMQMELATVAVCTGHAIYALLQASGMACRHTLLVAGCFDNPAGLASCLCLSWPLGFEWWSQTGKLKHTFFCMAKALCLCGIIACGSRTGLLCVLSVSLVMAFDKYGKNGKRYLYALSAAVLLLGLAAVLTFTCKRASTTGRWFIIERTAEMIGLNPVTGWGGGGFKAHYMDFQADYFAGHPWSPYTDVADQVNHPLCEYLNLAVDYGFAGIAVMLSLIFFTLRYHFRHRCASGRTGLYVLTAVAAFSLCSYPFLYPFTWVMTLFAIGAIFHPAIRCIRMSGAHTGRLVGTAGLAVSMFSALPLFMKICDELEWAKIEKRAEYGQSERMMPRYARLYGRMRHNPYFLYNYAVEELEAGRDRAADRTAAECDTYWADYDLELLRGEIDESLNEYGKATAHFRRAGNMCPSRLIPMEAWFDMSCLKGDSATADKIARNALAVKVKVRNAESERIQDKMRQFLKSRHV